MPDAYVLDANVLFSARLRDLWLELSTRGVAHVRLTELIDREWTAAVASYNSYCSYTNLLCSTAAAMKLAKSGWGSKGRLFSSG